jgi:molecular chaperone DnaJ
MEYHPDKTNGDKNKEDLFKKINHAYHVLSDPQQRQEYDLMGKPITSVSDFNMESVDELLRDVFMDMSMGKQDTSPQYANPPFRHDFTHVFYDGVSRSRSKTPDPEYIDISVSMSELFYGSKRSIQYDIRDMCSSCHPHKVNNVARDTIRCLQCHGNGVIANNIFSTRKCGACNGVGFLTTKEIPCHECHGTRYCNVPKTLTITIPRGVHDKYEFVMRGKGSYDVDGGHYKDVIVSVSHELPKGIRVDAQSNIHVDMEVTLVDLVCGFEKTIELYDGPVKIVSREFVNPSDPIRVERKGVPKYKDVANEHGDLFVHISVRYPSDRTMHKIKPIFMKLFKRTERLVDDEDSSISIN